MVYSKAPKRQYRRKMQHSGCKPSLGNAQEKAEEKAEEEKKAFEERLQSELKAQASRSATQLSEALSTSLLEKEAAVTAAVAAKALQLQAAKVVADKAHAALTARLEVWKRAERNENGIVGVPFSPCFSFQ